MKKNKIKVGINGIGRIGKAILRNNMDSSSFELVHINDINPDINNVVYQINYDSLYGNLISDQEFILQGDVIVNGKTSFTYSSSPNIDEVDWDSKGVDIVIDASGVKSNVVRSHELIKNTNVKHVVITHSPDEVDFTMILGVNEKSFDSTRHKVVSSSICDATALAPVLSNLNENFGIFSGHITTLHPWLNYQKLMDGPSSSWSVPGEIYHHYALGRSSIGNMIPKPTSALDATYRVLESLSGKIGSFSYRTPTNIVGSADLTLQLGHSVSSEEIIEFFEKLQNEQTFYIFNNTIKPLVSIDFLRTNCSVHIDHRWTQVVNGNLLKLVLWYDNEWGYSSKVVDQVSYIASKYE